MTKHKPDILKNLLLLIMFSGALLSLVAATGHEPFVTRTLSETGAELLATPPASASVYAIEEILPEGMTPMDISDGGAFDVAQRKIKWGPFFDTEARILLYDFEIVEGMNGPLSFTGVSSIDGLDLPIGGDSEWRRSPSEPPNLMIERPGPNDPVRLKWAGDSVEGVTLETADSVTGPWTPITEAELVLVDGGVVFEWVPEATLSFFRIKQNADDEPIINPTQLEVTPGHGDFAVSMDSSIQVRLPDPEAVDSDSIKLTVGDLGQFQLSDGSLGMNEGLLTFNPTSIGLLGGYNSVVPVKLEFTDESGVQFVETWSFRLEKETILTGEMLVLGSPLAQMNGQVLSSQQEIMLNGLNYRGRQTVAKQAVSAPWSLTQVLPDSLVFQYQGDVPPSFKVGQYLANLTPQKKDEIFYRTVSEVLLDVPGSQSVTVRTEDVGLLEIILQASFLANPQTTLSQVYEIAADGLLVNASQGFELGTTVVEEWFPEPGNGVSLEGTFSIEPTVSLAVDIQDSTVEDFFFRQEGVLDVSLDARLQASEQFDWSEKTPEPLYSTSRIFYLGQAGIVPIWVEAELNLDAEAGLNHQATGEISTGIRKRHYYWSEIVFSQRNPALNGMFASPPSAEIITRPVSMEIEGEVDAWVQLLPKLSVELESLFGVEVSLVPRLGIKGSAEFENPELTAAEFGLYGRIDLNAGLSLNGIESDLIPALDPIELAYYPWMVSFPGFRIIEQPQDKEVFEGEDVFLRVVVEIDDALLKPEDLLYQWHKDGEAVSGSAPLSDVTGSGLLIESFDASNAGEYWVEIVRGSVDAGIVSERVTLKAVEIECDPDSPALSYLPAGTEYDSDEGLHTILSPDEVEISRPGWRYEYTRTSSDTADLFIVEPFDDGFISTMAQYSYVLQFTGCYEGTYTYQLYADVYDSEDGTFLQTITDESSGSFSFELP